MVFNFAYILVEFTQAFIHIQRTKPVENRFTYAILDGILNKNITSIISEAKITLNETVDVETLA